MKIRNGFVSNSSSSSFLLIGDEINLNDIKSLSSEYLAIGKNIYEANDLINIDSYFKLIMLKESGYNFDVYKVNKATFEPDLSTILDLDDETVWELDPEQVEDLIRKKYNQNCIYTYIDYCKTDEDFDEFCEQYGLELSEDEIERKAQAFTRELKLNRILDEQISKI